MICKNTRKENCITKFLRGYNKSWETLCKIQLHQLLKSDLSNSGLNQILIRECVAKLSYIECHYFSKCFLETELCVPKLESTASIDLERGSKPNILRRPGQPT